jgi:DNA-binding PadR family transcriptional regulator
MENIILGLLLFKSMTVYEIKMYVQRNLTTICSDSLGSIQIAIKKVLNKGYITTEECLERDLVKKKHSITSLGVEHYKEWVGSPINIAKMTNMEESKFYFLGTASKEKRISFLKSYISSLKEQFNKLVQIKELTKGAKDIVIRTHLERIANEKQITDNLSVVSEEDNMQSIFENTYSYQIYLLEYGLNRVKSDISFYEKILKLEMEDK